MLGDEDGLGPHQARPDDCVLSEYQFTWGTSQKRTSWLPGVLELELGEEVAEAGEGWERPVLLRLVHVVPEELEQSGAGESADGVELAEDPSPDPVVRVVSFLDPVLLSEDLLPCRQGKAGSRVSSGTSLEVVPSRVEVLSLFLCCHRLTPSICPGSFLSPRRVGQGQHRSFNA